jgi:NADH:ubiquinone oxidoreductase subunit H
MFILKLIVSKVLYIVVIHASMLLYIVCVLMLIAFYTLSERKIMALVQRRRGPNVTGLFGLFQPLADGIKLIFKEFIIPRESNYFLFVIAPVVTFTISMEL